MSYIDVVIPLNISGLNQATHHFHEKVTLLQHGYNDQEKYAIWLEKYGSRANNDASTYALLHFRRQISHLLELMLRDADNLQGSLDSLQS